MPKMIPVRPVQHVRHGWHLLRNRKAMWQMIRETWKGRYRMSLLSRVIIILSVVYIAFPFDLVPDYIPVLGWVDDGFVFYLLLKRLASETQRYSRFKAMERKTCQ